MTTFDDFQNNTRVWLIDCFNEEKTFDLDERRHQFMAEAAELVQVLKMPRAEAHSLVDAAYDREPGQLGREIGGVLLTLAGVCLATGNGLAQCGENELKRVKMSIEKIREKQKLKDIERAKAESVITTEGMHLIFDASVYDKFGIDPKHLNPDGSDHRIMWQIDQNFTYLLECVKEHADKFPVPQHMLDAVKKFEELIKP